MHRCQHSFNKIPSNLWVVHVGSNSFQGISYAGKPQVVFSYSFKSMVITTSVIFHQIKISEIFQGQVLPLGGFMPIFSENLFLKLKLKILKRNKFFNSNYISSHSIKCPLAPGSNVIKLFLAVIYECLR